MATTRGNPVPVDDDGGSRPVPDPTLLTTAQLVRATRAERDYVDGRIAVLMERLRGIDTATVLLNETVNRVPTETQTAVGRLQDLTDEKFRSVGLQFQERDTRSERESRDNKVAVDAAFAAQKEAASEQNKSNTLAITKSELATQETINKLAELFKTTTDALSDKLDDMKDRLGRLEATVSNIQTARATGQQSQSSLYIVMGLLLTLGGIIVAIILSQG